MRLSEAQDVETCKTKNLLEARKILNRLEVPFWLSNGTLLGYFREQGFIEHDPDIDVGVWITDWNPDIMQSFIRSGFRLYKRYGSLESGYQYSFHKRDIKFDIFFYVDEADHTWMPVFVGKRMLKYIFPKFTLRPITFLGEEFLIPENTEEVIVAQYGEEWRIPIIEWSYVTSPRNVIE